MVVGLPGLAEALVSQHPGLAVRSAGSGTSLRSALNEVVAGDNPYTTVIVAAHGSDPNMEETALALVRGGYRILVVNGVGQGAMLCHPEIPTLTAPFAPRDVVAVVEQLAGALVPSPPAAPFDLEWAVPRPARPGSAPQTVGVPRLAPGAPVEPQAPYWPGSETTYRPGYETTAPVGSAPVGSAPVGSAPVEAGPSVLCDEKGRTRPFSPHSSAAGELWGAGAADNGWSGTDSWVRPHPPGRPKVLVFACPKGGSGKTTLSLTYASFLGAALRPARRSVIWVDGNLQQADGARYLGADERSSRSITDLIGQPELDERTVLEAVTPPERTGQPISALFGPTLKSDADPKVITADLYRQTVSILRRHYDVVIVDTPVAEHYDRFFREFALPEADQLVVVVPPLLPVVRGVREWLDMQSHPVAAGGSAFPPAKVRLVLNMASERSGCPVEMVRDAWLTRWSWAGEIPYDPACTEATNNGELLAEHSNLAAPLAELVRLTTGDVIEVRGARDRRGRRRLVGLLRDAFLR
jgi:MinD-like ATPase involved in chromosome partitioning or flagellar assembly